MDKNGDFHWLKNTRKKRQTLVAGQAALHGESLQIGLSGS